MLKCQGIKHHRSNAEAATASVQLLHLPCLAESIVSRRDLGTVAHSGCYAAMPASVQVLPQHLEDFAPLLCKFSLRNRTNLLKKKLHFQPLFLRSLAIPSDSSLLAFFFFFPFLLLCHLRVIKTG